MIKIVLSFLVLLLAVAEGREVSDINLGGLRKVHATIKPGASHLVCEINFIPVSCFDLALNSKVNKQKARAYALCAIAKASGIRENEVSAANLRLLSSPATHENRYHATFQLDRVVKAQNKTTVKSSSSLPKANTKVLLGDENKETNLLSCRNDLQETLETVLESFEEQIRQLTANDKLDDQVASIESGGIDVFNKLSNDIKNEKLLLQIEKQELLKIVKTHTDSFMTQLNEAYQQKAKLGSLKSR